MKRAMTDEAKKKRYEDILDVTQDMYTHHEFDDIKMIDIARSAGLGKGTLFSYFSSKEALFIGLMLRCYGQFFEAMQDRFSAQKNLSKNDFIALFVAFIKKSITDHEMLYRLIMIQHSLEMNIDLETARDLKDFLMQHIMITGQVLLSSCHQLTLESVGKLMLNLQAFAVGYMVFSNPPKPIQEALKDDELSFFRLTMEEDMMDTLSVYMNGLIGSSVKDTDSDILQALDV